MMIELSRRMDPASQAHRVGPPPTSKLSARVQAISLGLDPEAAFRAWPVFPDLFPAIRQLARTGADVQMQFIAPPTARAELSVKVQRLNTGEAPFPQ